MRGLEEIPDEELHDELARRDRARYDGKCDYCGRVSGSEPRCKFPGRHGRVSLPAEADAGEMKMNYEEALANYLKVVKELSDSYMEKTFPLLPKRIYAVRPGRVFDKVIITNNPGESVHSFVAKKDVNTKALGAVPCGSIMKAATWNQPAKHARGSIFDEPARALSYQASVVYLE